MPGRHADLEAHPASFRDPSGFVFLEDGLFKRAVGPRGQGDYERLMRSGLHDELVRRGWTVPHEEERPRTTAAGETLRILTPRQIEYASYPYEWSFHQLKDAALLTLGIQQEALRRGMTLKDASAFNVQFSGFRPLFLDTLSFEPDRGGPWVAYRQFCEHFLAPLVLMSRLPLDSRVLLRGSLDGVSLDHAVMLLPFRSCLSPGPLMHLHLHSRLARRFNTAGAHGNGSGGRNGRARPDRKRELAASLISAVEALQPHATGSPWVPYGERPAHYAEADVLAKRKTVLRALDETEPRLVLDLGANTGAYSRLVSGRRIRAVSLDSDAACVDRNYLQAKAGGDEFLLPLVMDVSNPSPALGFGSAERLALLERPRPDLVLVLALVHHLRITANVPFARIAEFLARLADRALVEYVPPEDPKARVLAGARAGSFPDYTFPGFVGAFGRYFAEEWRVALDGTGRSLHLFRHRGERQ